MEKRPRLGVLYQFFHPDDVVSARIFSDLCVDLHRLGWDVTAWPCNLSCHDSKVRYPMAEEWEGVAIRRVWRPAFRQASKFGRAFNALWMLVAWCVVLLRERSKRFDVLVLGTDPIFGILLAPVIRTLLPYVRIVHWCFDLYPEYAIAEGMIRADSWLVRGLRRVLPGAYASCDLVVDLGQCMRNRLDAYGHSCRRATLTPWALSTPSAIMRPDPTTRRGLFGDNALGLLYSGNFGRPHSHSELVNLARRLRGSGVHFSFGVRGSRSDELHQAVRPEDANVSFADFVPEAALANRLAAADIHMASLRPEYTGLAVPSKFFGSLASGRPVIFAGSSESALAQWIEEHKVGWVLNERTQDHVAAQLLDLKSSPDRLRELQQHCFDVYHDRFSRAALSTKWDQELRDLLLSKAARRRADKDGSRAAAIRSH
jgi:colanic acid biosynthesis glycosyl transferase WcaI